MWLRKPERRILRPLPEALLHPMRVTIRRLYARRQRAVGGVRRLTRTPPCGHAGTQAMSRDMPVGKIPSTPSGGRNVRAGPDARNHHFPEPNYAQTQQNSDLVSNNYYYPLIHDLPRCYNCFRTNHMIDPCRHKSRLTCFKCNGLGHKEKHCY